MLLNSAHLATLLQEVEYFLTETVVVFRVLWMIPLGRKRVVKESWESWEFWESMVFSVFSVFWVFLLTSGGFSLTERDIWAKIL